MQFNDNNCISYLLYVHLIYITDHSHYFISLSGKAEKIQNLESMTT